jgi:hypothetical protein
MDTCETDSHGIATEQHDVPSTFTKANIVNISKNCAYYIKQKKRRCKLNAFPNYKYCTRHIHEQEPLQSIDKPEECPVCVEDFQVDEKPLTCGHWVHKSCVIKSGKGQCPICRFELYLSLKERHECAIYRQRYNNPSNRGSTGYIGAVTALGAQIDAILYAYPPNVQHFISDVGLDNIIDSNLYAINPLLFQNTLIAYLDGHI